MFVELTFLDAILSRRLRKPDAPICELTPNTAEKRRRPYSTQEIRAMRETVSVTAGDATYNEGSIALPAVGWLHPFCIKGLGYWPKQTLAARQK
jgi:hypothetical protein